MFLSLISLWNLGICCPCTYNAENIGSNVDSDIQNKKNSVGNAVNELMERQYDSTIDERLPETVTLLTTPDGGKLYLVGTAHFSVESQNDVSKVTILYIFCLVKILISRG